MARRSTQVTIQNNMDLDLTMVHWHLCHGEWSDGYPVPPATIGKGTSVTLQSESSGVGTGTEGWVTYQITNPTPCVPELVYIYWDNPFVWSDGTSAVNGSVTTTDRKPDCLPDDNNWDAFKWDTPGGFPHGGTNPPECTHVIFGVSSAGGGIQGLTWFDFAAPANLTALLLLTLLGQADINLEFTIGLGLKGSMRQMFETQSIGAIARAKRQPSLRALMHL
jgi:hypothetical protein